MAPAADVIVVGGGPAGSSAAFFLSRAGARVLVLDRARFPRDKPCAEYLSPQASRLLDAMGVLNAIEQRAARLTGMKIRSPAGVEIHGEFAAAHGFIGFRDRGLALRRTELDLTLLDAARHAGAEVREATIVRDLAFDDEGRVTGVMAQDRNGPVGAVHAKLVIGADGLRSVVARRAALGRFGRWPRRVALVAHYRGVDGVDDCGEMNVFPWGYVGIADVGNGVSNVALVVPAAVAREMAGDAAAFLDRWLARAPHLARRLTNAQRVTEVRAVGPFNWRARRAWRRGLTLVGDAADFFDPFTGEGIYAALRGGELLAPHALRAAGARSEAESDTALREYDAARRREFGGKWQIERAVGVAVAFPLLINHAARSLAARKPMADLLVGVAGDFVPPREVLRASFVARLILGGFRKSRPVAESGLGTPALDRRSPVGDR